MMTEKKSRSGTKEWSSHSINILYGCSNDCSYCYAKKIWERFRKDKGSSPLLWSQPLLNYNAFSRSEHKKKGIIMFPTSHDITEDIIEIDKDLITNLRKEDKITQTQYLRLMDLAQKHRTYSVLDLCLLKYNQLLKNGNEILIVSKPRLNIVKSLAKELIKYEEKIEFRFTITTMDNQKIKDLEPNAPLFEERLESLKYIYKFKTKSREGYKNSVSIEPFLDSDPIPLIKQISPFVKGDIWIGLMSGITYKYHLNENLIKIIEDIKALPSDIFNKIKLKDSLTIKGFSLR